MGSLKLTFMGTNGWFASENGNTTSALIETPGRYIVLDAGDGIRRLDEFAAEKKPVDIFLSHFHLDHIAGLHILPKFRNLHHIRIFGQTGTKETLGKLLDRPFTAPLSLLKTIGINVSVHDLNEGKNELDGYSVHCAPLVHADPAWGFRFEFPSSEGTKILSYCTDTGPCDNLVELSRNAHALITECSLLPGAKTDAKWPHLSPEAAAEAAKSARCQQLFLTHFAAHLYQNHFERTRAQEAARAIFPATTSAKDGMAVEI
jgi:ribonuclease BN (tRNA processing enzyme)